MPNGGLFLGQDVGSTLNLLVYNNTFYNAPIVIQNMSATVTAFEFRNNILFDTTGVPLTDSAGKITAHSNNLYHRGSGTLVSSNGTNFTASNLADYESSGSGADPLFINSAGHPDGFVGTFGIDLAPNTNGFALQDGSPAIGAGAILAAGFVGSINSATRAAGGWDIGAYQRTASAAAPPVAPSNLQVTP